MKSLDWNKLDAESFQKFCNVLLTFEISKKYDGYSSKGKDGGIDGKFIGEYGGKSGYWRFQAKTHFTATNIAINSLKQDIKQDILGKEGDVKKSNVQDENYIIYLTNVYLSSDKKRKELLDEANSCLQKIDKTQVSVDIWDGNKLEAILVQYPIIYQWFFDYSTSQLQDYHKYFEDELSIVENKSYTLNNQFYFREECLKKLMDFYQDENQFISVVSGVAGIGKTRLCIESFKQFSDKNDWLILIAAIKNLNFDKLNEAFDTSKKLIILLDDAHEYNPTIISDLFRLVKIHSKKKNIKLVLTTRSVFLEGSIKKIKEYEQEEIVKIPIDKLNPNETEDFINKELKSYKLKPYIDFFVSITNGRPLLILTLVKTIQAGAPLSEIKKDSFLKSYVSNYYSELIEVVNEKFGINKLQIRKIITLFSLLEPLEIGEDKLIEAIVANESIPVDELNIIIEQLKEFKFIIGNYEYSLKPDYYSDILLADSIKSKAWLLQKVQQYPLLVNNIIKNLSSIEEVNNEKNILDELLSEYVNLIDSVRCKNELNKILSTFQHIVFVKPKTAINALNRVLKIFHTKNHILYQEFLSDASQKKYEHDEYLNMIKSILSELILKEENFNDVFVIVEKYYSLTEDRSVIRSCWGFNVYDEYNNFRLARQRFFMSKMSTILSRGFDEREFAILHEGVKNMMQLSFTTTQMKPFVYPPVVGITTYYIPEAQGVIDLRISIIRFLCNFYTASDDDKHKSEIIKLILDIPREILSTKKNTTIYKGNEEIRIVCDFLAAITTNQIPLAFKNEISEKIYWYKRWGIDTEFISVLNKIESNLVARNLTEKIASLLTIRYDEKLKENEENFEKESKTIIEDNSSEDLFDCLLDISKDLGDSTQYFYIFLSKIAQNKEKGTSFINYGLKKEIGFIIKFGSVLLRIFRFDYVDKNYYWKYVNEILKLNNPNADNCVLDVFRGIDESNVSELSMEDFDIIKRIFEKGNKENEYLLSFSIPYMLHINKDEALQLLQQYIKNGYERNVDHLIYMLFERISGFELEKTELLLENTIHLNITYFIEKALGKVKLSRGYKPIQKYIIKRFFYKRNHIDKERKFNYDIIPHNNQNSIFRTLKDETYYEYFNEILQWFLTIELTSLEQIFGENIIEYSIKDKYINSSLFDIYSEKINAAVSANELFNLAISLKAFKEKNDYMIELVVKILEKSFDTFSESDYKKIRTQCYIAVESFGVMSGTPGEPFREQVDLKELLVKSLEKYKNSRHKIKEFFELFINALNKDINRQINEIDQEIW